MPEVAIEAIKLATLVSGSIKHRLTQGRLRYFRHMLLKSVICLKEECKLCMKEWWVKAIRVKAVKR